MSLQPFVLSSLSHILSSLFLRNKLWIGHNKNVVLFQKELMSTLPSVAHLSNSLSRCSEKRNRSESLPRSLQKELQKWITHPLGIKSATEANCSIRKELHKRIAPLLPTKRAAEVNRSLAHYKNSEKRVFFSKIMSGFTENVEKSPFYRSERIEWL